MLTRSVKRKVTLARGVKRKREHGGHDGDLNVFVADCGHPWCCVDRKLSWCQLRRLQEVYRAKLLIAVGALSPLVHSLEEIGIAFGSELESETHYTRLYAAELAVQDINRNPALLPGRRVALVLHRTYCDRSRGLLNFVAQHFGSSNTECIVANQTRVSSKEETRDQSLSRGRTRARYTFWYVLRA